MWKIRTFALSDVEKFDMQGSAEPPTTSDFLLEVAFFCPLGLARFARSRALGHIPQPVAVGTPWQRSASLGALSRSLSAPCGLAELARFARSRGLATLATSRGCRLFSASARAILPVLPLRPCHLPECLRLQPPRHPHTAYSVPDRRRSWNFMCSVREPRSSARCFQLHPPISHVSPTSPLRLPHVSPTSPQCLFLRRGAPRHCHASALPLSAVKPAFSGNSSPPCP